MFSASFHKQITRNLVVILVMASIALGTLPSCKAKYGCPSNGKNIGAERLNSGEKVPKAKKFRV